MNLKELIKEVYVIKHNHLAKANTYLFDKEERGRLEGIKQTVEAVETISKLINTRLEREDDWKKLKELLGLK